MKRPAKLRDDLGFLRIRLGKSGASSYIHIGNCKFQYQVEKAAMRKGIKICELAVA
jgi:hypothetical protein